MKSNSGRQMKSDQMRRDRLGKQGGLADETQGLCFGFSLRQSLSFVMYIKNPGGNQSHFILDIL